jgi:site-specific recombinase XerC
VVATIVAAATPKDRALLAVVLGGGLRVSEATGLDVTDVLEELRDSMPDLPVVAAA